MQKTSIFASFDNNSQAKKKNHTFWHTNGFNTLDLENQKDNIHKPNNLFFIKKKKKKLKNPNVEMRVPGNEEENGKEAATQIQSKEGN